MIRLDVWLTLPSGENVHVGSLVTADPDPIKGGVAGQFRYNPEYLSHPRAFALDPLNLPLVSDIFNADRPSAGVHGVFEDSLPDDWGRRIMARQHKLGRAEQRAPNLLRLLANSGLGALSYVEQGKAELKKAGVSLRQLQELAHLANVFEKEPSSAAADEFSLLFQAGSSPGGARPKALIEDDGVPCIAKFGSIRDKLDVVGLEAAAMELSRRAGIETADSRIVSLATGKCLLVKRFDVAKNNGRNHLISMQSIMKADGYYNAGYGELAEVIRHMSLQPGQDMQRLYRQMVFNVMIGNTDDHLKNFLMLHSDDGWQLSPAFDLVPNIGFNREHVLSIGPGSRLPTGKTLADEAKKFGVKRREQAIEIVRSIHAIVASWEQVFKEHDVPQSDRDAIGKDICLRLEKTRVA